MDVRLPDGTLIQGVPDGTTKADLVAKLKGNGMAVPSEWLADAPKAPERSTVQKAGAALMDIPRQVGLTARYGLEGLAGAAEIVTEPLRYVTDRATGMTGRTAPLSKLATRAADAIGLPSPQTADERVIGDASRLVAGSGGLVGAGRAAAGAGAATLGNFLAVNPMAQATSAAGAGLAGGSVREAGGSEGGQVVAALAGGLAGAAVPALIGKVAAGARSGAGKLADLVNPARNVQQQPLDMRISATLQGGGMDWSDVPERVRQAVRQDVQRALQTGDDLDPEALRRLVDFRTVGATPTRGSLTLDPVQVTRERNLAKAGANSTDTSAQRLSMLEADNNRTLLRGFSDMGADRGADAYAVGTRGIDSLQGWADQQRGNVNSLYQAARDSQGRSVPLDGAGFTREASALLDENLLGHALPKDVESHLNRIAKGEVPFNVDYAEQLKTVIGKLQRGTSDGSTRMALGMVRKALDNATPAGSGIPNPGNLPAMSTPIEGDAIAAFNRARGANREMMQQVERTPALQALWDGDIAPDDFLRRYVTSPSARVRDVAETVRVAGPEGKQALRDGVLGHLRQAATGGQADETARFSAAGFRRALDQIGDRKLALLFEREEIASLKALSRVAGYTTHQPVGSAVNNSNSGAMMVGKGMDLLGGLGDKLKFAGVGDQLNVLVRGRQQSQALNAAPAIVRQTDAQRVPLSRLLAPTGQSAALFAAPLSPQRDDDQ